METSFSAMYRYVRHLERPTDSHRPNDAAYWDFGVKIHGVLSICFRMDDASYAKVHLYYI